MMNKKKTSKIGLFKYALLLLMTGLLILTGNAQVVAEVAENIVVGQVSVNKEFTIKGQVMDENGKPVHGVNVIIKDSNVGSVTDPKGNFSVKFDKPGVLLFSYVGKKTESIAFTQETTDLKITMKADLMQLEGIVVVGYSGEGNSTIKDKESGEIFVVVEDMPQFPGGNIQKFLAKNVKYPVIAQEKGIQGRVFVSFVVDKTGKVVQAKVIKSVDPSLDEEALRVIGLMPLWKPGKQRGMPVDVQYTLPIDFFLQKAGESIMTVGTVNTFEATGLNDSTVSVTKNSMTKISVRGYKNSVTHSYSTPKVDSTKMPGGVSTDNRVTFSVKEKPLYIVDGKKMPESFNMNDMPTETVKQITVLKGDTAVVIYGEEGRSGVVVVTTEKED